MTPNVVVWNEYRQERSSPEIGSVYPEGIHGAIRDGLAEYGIPATTATLDEPEHGLTQERLDRTDVLVWWGHIAHDEVVDAVVKQLVSRVMAGMGMVVLHSGQGSRVFRALLGTSGEPGGWREDARPTQIWTVDPGHRIAAGVPIHVTLPAEEAYAEPFDIPVPDELVFLSAFEGGEAFRSGCCFFRGRGRIFYFQPGHETHPTYFDPKVRLVVANAVRWAAGED
jgi:trehalose utilization protein